MYDTFITLLSPKYLSKSQISSLSQIHVPNFKHLSLKNKNKKQASIISNLLRFY